MATSVFAPVSTRVSFPDEERKILALWQERDVFSRSVDAAKDKKPFVFYEGPPTANGMPHPGHVLTRVMKDVFLRYRSMTGWYVPRRAGWDTHGLPVEVEVEKALGISGRAAIEEYGVEPFTHKCIESVFRYIDEWQKLTSRVGFWVDLESAYVTFHKSYVESVWWALSELYKQNLLYQDYKVVWWWPQGGTALSAGEVGQGYQKVQDPSVYVRFSAVGHAKRSFVAWTTTPWTLPSNVALAIGAELDYAVVTTGTGAEQEELVLAEALIEKVLEKREYQVLSKLKGRELVGQKYQPLFNFRAPEGGKAFEIMAADFVSLDAGTGIVHCAPAFGEDDFRATKANGFGFLQLIAPDGTFVADATPFAGKFCKAADRDIIKHLKNEGRVLREETYLHDYPFCWRKSSDPLIQYARKSWYIRTTAKIDKAIANNQQIHWEPEHIKDGRFGDFLRGNVDWAISRERFWGTPLPIWVNDVSGKRECIASADEIKKKNPNAFKTFEEAKRKNPTLSDHLMVHNPWIDDVTWENPGEAGVYRRVPEVIDCWFDSGCMPFAQHGYPHQNKEAFAKEFPAQFITEAVDQTRGWFYSLLMISSMLFENEKMPHPFENCVVLGIITDEKGKKLSKSLKNYKEPTYMFDQFGADALRWALFVQSAPGQTSKWFEGGASDAIRDHLLKVWNCYSFFVTYANIDAWTPTANASPVAERHVQDRWILSELSDTIEIVSKHLENYRSQPASQRLGAFVDSLSNWYLRRCRARFWAGAETQDKLDAYRTLYDVLVALAKLSAPFTPFLAEQMYQNLVVRTQGAAAESVHLTDFPKPEHLDRDLLEAMGAARLMVQLGSKVRATQKIKVRQPLARGFAIVASDALATRIKTFTSDILEELNIEHIEFVSDPTQYVEFQVLPNFKTLGKKLGKEMQLCKDVLGKADGRALYEALSKGENIDVDLPSGKVSLTPEDVEVRLTAKPGFAAASDGGQVMVLDTTLDERLIRKGLARELVRAIQDARKTREFAFEQRIRVSLYATDVIAKVVEEHREYIAGETLATELNVDSLRADSNAPPDGFVTDQGEELGGWSWQMQVEPI